MRNVSWCLLYCAGAVACGASPEDADYLPDDELGDPGAMPVEQGSDIEPNAAGLVDKAVFSHLTVPFNSSGGISIINDNPNLSPEHNAGDYMCVLGGVTGDFGSSGRSQVLSNGSDWIGRGRGRANCTRWENFINRSIINMPAPISAQTDDQAVAVNLLAGSTFSFVTRVLGELEGGGEVVQTNQATSTALRNTLFLDTHAEDGFLNSTNLEASAFSVFVGSNSNDLVHLMGRIHDANGVPNGAVVRGNINTVGSTFTFNVTSRIGQGFQTIFLTPANSGICALSRVSGNFNGGGEHLRIELIQHTDGVFWWVLKATGEGGTAYGSARCMSFNQT